MPVIMDDISHPVEDPPGTVLVGKNTHPPGPSPYLSEIPLQYVGGAYLLPETPGERVIVEAVVKVLFHTPDCPLLFTCHFSFHVLKHFSASRRLGAAKIPLASAMTGWILSYLILCCSHNELAYLVSVASDVKTARTWALFTWRAY